MRITNREKVNLSKLAQPLIEAPELEFKALNGQSADPADNDLGWNIMIAPMTRNLSVRHQAFIQNSLLPDASNGTGEKRLQNKKGHRSPAGDQGRQRFGWTLKHDVKDYAIVSWIVVMLVANPVKECTMNLDITSVGDLANADESVMKIRTAVGVEVAGRKNTQHSAVGSLQLRTPEVLAAPDVTEKPLVNVERTHCS
jgi:hypothetical protein